MIGLTRKDVPIWVNEENIAYFAEARDEGTDILFGKEFGIRVQERPDIVLQRIEAAKKHIKK